MNLALIREVLLIIVLVLLIVALLDGTVVVGQVR